MIRFLDSVFYCRGRFQVFPNLVRNKNNPDSGQSYVQSAICFFTRTSDQVIKQKITKSSKKSNEQNTCFLKKQFGPNSTGAGTYSIEPLKEHLPFLGMHFFILVMIVTPPSSTHGHTSVCYIPTCQHITQYNNHASTHILSFFICFPCSLYFISLLYYCSREIFITSWRIYQV